MIRPLLVGLLLAILAGIAIALTIPAHAVGVGPTAKALPPIGSLNVAHPCYPIAALTAWARSEPLTMHTNGNAVLLEYTVDGGLVLAVVVQTGIACLVWEDGASVAI